MNADARHGGLRPKRCLPAKLHARTAHHYRLTKKSKRPVCACRFVFSFPKSRQTIVTASKRANSRFFTDCYPISAVFTPKLTKLRHGWEQSRQSHLATEYIINHLISVV